MAPAEPLSGNCPHSILYPQRAAMNAAIPLRPSRLGTLVLLAALGTSPTSAQESPDLPAEAPARSVVLRLTDGRVLRVRARESAQGWEVRRGREWSTLPADLVARAANEADLLKEARNLERGVDRNDLVRRSMYASWLVEQGLQTEGLLELDRVLAADPDEPHARGVLEHANLPVALPDPRQNVGTFLELAAQAGPAVGEIAVQRMESMTSEGEIEALEEEILADLVDRDPRRRAFAALALRRLFPGRHADSLLSRALFDVSGDVRTSASLSLRALADESVVVPVLGALGSKHDKVRLHAAQALGTMNYAVAAQPLYHHLVALQSGSGSLAPRSHIFVGNQRAYVQDFDVEVAQFQAIADPIINLLTEGVVLDVAVRGVVEYAVQAERAAVRRSLAQLTGANPGNTTAAWKDWWEEHGDEWTVADSSLDRPRSPFSRDH